MTTNALVNIWLYDDQFNEANDYYGLFSSLTGWDAATINTFVR